MLLSDPDFRKETGPKAIPLAKKMAAVLAEVEKADPEGAADYHKSGLMFTMYAAALGDDDAMVSLMKQGSPRHLMRGRPRRCDDRPLDQGLRRCHSPGKAA